MSTKAKHLSVTTTKERTFSSGPAAVVLRFQLRCERLDQQERRAFRRGGKIFILEEALNANASGSS